MNKVELISAVKEVDDHNDWSPLYLNELITTIDYSIGQPGNRRFDHRQIGRVCGHGITSLAVICSSPMTMWAAGNGPDMVSSRLIVRTLRAEWSGIVDDVRVPAVRPIVSAFSSTNFRSRSRQHPSGWTQTSPLVRHIFQFRNSRTQWATLGGSRSSKIDGHASLCCDFWLLFHSWPLAC